MRPRLDPPTPAAFRGPHAWTPQGYHSPRDGATTTPPPRPRYGRAFDWLFAKGGMSAVVLIGLIVTPILAMVPGPQLFAAPVRRQPSANPSPLSSPRTRSMYAPVSNFRVMPARVIDRTVP